MPRIGRPPIVEAERRRSVGISLAPSEVRALHELAALRGDSQGMVVGRLVISALKREKKRRALP